jgi:hypothetical protein
MPRITWGISDGAVYHLGNGTGSSSAGQGKISSSLQEARMEGQRGKGAGFRGFMGHNWLWETL